MPRATGCCAAKPQGKDHEFLADVPNQQHFDATIEPGKVYYYRLQTLAGGVISPLSEERRVDGRIC